MNMRLTGFPAGITENLDSGVSILSYDELQV
jgi:hypothetical protein